MPKIVVVLLAFNLLAIVSISAEYLCRKFNINNASTVTIENQELERLLDVKACSEIGNCYDVLLAIGRVDEIMANQILSATNKLVDKPLCFLSQGGDSLSALRISNIIRENSIATCLADEYLLKGERISASSKGARVYCESACGFIIMSSNTRISIGSEVTIGIHSPARSLDLCICNIPIDFFGVDDSDILTLIDNTQSEKHKEKLNSLYLKSLQTPNDEIYNLTQQELKTFEVFNEIR